MAYTPKTWADGQAGGTPITAAELNRIETGVKGAHDAVAALPEPPTVPSKMPAAEATTGTATTARTVDAATLRTAVEAHGLKVGTTATTALAGNTSIPSLPATATAAELQAGTVTQARLVSPKLLADEIDRRVGAAIAAIPTG